MTDSRKPYVPIACAAYDLFEATIVRGGLLRLRWLDEAGRTRSETLRPLDLQTRGGAEFLRAQSPSGVVLELRLDRITLALPAG